MDESLAVELEAVRWFEAAGQASGPDLPFAVTPVSSWAEAIEACSDPAWEEVTLEARNRLTEFLFRRHNARAWQWNSITEAAKSRVVTPLAEKVWQPFAQGHGLGREFVDCVSWDVLAAIMEHEYEDCPGRPAFFLRLLDVYRAGHFPCGWRGEWPAGRLVVF